MGTRRRQYILWAGWCSRHDGLVIGDDEVNESREDSTGPRYRYDNWFGGGFFLARMPC